MSTQPPVLDPEATVRTSWARVPLIAAALSLVVGVILLAFAWPAVTASAHDLPVGIVGTDEQVDQVTDAIDEKADGAIELIRYDDRDAAVTAIDERQAYGAIVLGAEQTDAPEVLKATAANSSVAQMLDGIAATLQTQIDAQILSAVEANIATAQEKAAESVKAAIQAAVQAALSGQTPEAPSTGDTAAIEIPTITVEVTDLAPFADADPRGAGLTAAMFPLVMGGMIGGIGLTLLVKGGGGRRAVGVVVYAAAAGIVLAGVLQGAFGALQGDWWLNAAAIAVSIGAISGTITGLAGLIGPAGVGVGAAFTMLVANPISAATLPVEFIAAPWGAIGQHLPPGAAATLIRNLSYFPDADVSGAWTLLIVWALVGLTLTAIDIPGRRLRAGVSRAEHPLTT
ncbi:hypothetical protein ACFQRL_00245 [Microbacterium fluvii]|uniref:ABC transporter permease n=1 Tax=Microbacterium fluvii TaxID=415215 RepID=A0ABW2HC24_9MICO|nr:hypothetical protein [Microbacterium fluvii]MCU4671015.1 hypothetical protein [Microbacterium fluvii]